MSAMGALAVCGFAAAPLRAQPRAPNAGPGNRSGAAVSARAEAPFDLPGYWVSLVTQNWRFRMIVPLRGDYAGVPINDRAKQFADGWNPADDIAAGKECEAYGAPGIMQIPERLHITWQDDRTLRVDTDAGRQTRLLHFGAAAEPTIAATLEGYSQARWLLLNAGNAIGGDGAARGLRSGSLRVDTDHLLPGLLRKNGIPYGAETRTIEYWKVLPGEADRWLAISAMVRDPEYLASAYVYPVVFQREADGSKFNPSACSLTF